MPSSPISPRICVWVGPTNVAPMLATSLAPAPIERLKQRPPTRPRASSTITDLPAAAIWRAAVSPESPAPTTATSAWCTVDLGLAGLCLGLWLVLGLGVGDRRHGDAGSRHERSRDEPAAGDGALPRIGVWGHHATWTPSAITRIEALIRLAPAASRSRAR